MRSRSQGDVDTATAAIGSSGGGAKGTSTTGGLSESTIGTSIIAGAVVAWGGDFFEGAFAQAARIRQAAEIDHLRCQRGS
ncbi:MAG: hypothetical protein ABI411_21290, partial [Tahibacter sp.]